MNTPILKNGSPGNANFFLFSFPDMTISLRERYLEYFKAKGHTIISSAPLRPENDPTTLFTGSGMQPMIPYLLGESHPLGQRITDSQKAFRTQDIEEVGDNRHTTFFEMLGNWSFGDYFKQEQIRWMFDFLTEEIGLDPNRLYFSCFRGNKNIGIPRDTESAELWQTLLREKGVQADIVEYSAENGMQKGKIVYYDEKKNWWSRAGIPDNMPLGEPGGPDTEMFWDFDPENRLRQHETSLWKDSFCHINCDCGRFMEIGNNVFMEYQKTETGFINLVQKNVDFGGGLERLSAAAIDSPDVFATDLFEKAREAIKSISGKLYGEHPEETFAYRVILDHLRAAVFLIGDDIIPSNKDQGYFTRRLIRRAVRFGGTIGIQNDFTTAVGTAFIETYTTAYPSLLEKQSFILSELSKEESKFRKTLETGLKEFKKLSSDTVSGHDAFLLFSSYGFPVEITEELAKESGKTIDLDGFKQELAKHQALSRAGAEQKFKGGLADHSDISVRYHTATHLLHQALRQVLGEHVAQKGSNITPERLRFDFSHSTKLTDEEKTRVETIVNEAISSALPVTYEDLLIDEARKRGAIGLFEEKYGEKVRVYSVGDFSMEFCGGPHVTNTSLLGRFKIEKEEACSAGIRRIKATLV